MVKPRERLYIIRLCKQCGVMFKCRKDIKKQKLCSIQCHGKSIVGHKAWNKGLVGWHSESHKKALRESAPKGKNHKSYGKKWWRNPETGKAWTFKGIITSTNGYISVYKPKHPRADSKGYIYQHRHLMEEKLGRFLDKNEIVHHINHDKHDNRIENLEIMTKAEHNHIHHFGVPKKRKTTSYRLQN